MSDLAAALRPHLEQDPRGTPSPGDRLAAVLALVVEEPAPSVLFTERTATMSRHAGEVSFPGGLQDPEDRSLLDTALREAAEEIGLARGSTDVLGALPAIHTFVSGILVTPFVGVTRSLPRLRVSDAEIARVLVTPLTRLAEVEEERELHREGARVWKGWWYELDDATVWGATGSMLHALLGLMRKEAPWTVS
ncbi:MAG TPA: CoA pyrophosphatase [Actinomycetota bacterium]